MKTNMFIKILMFAVLAVVFFSCVEEHGKIKVQNKVSNVKMQNISWGDYQIYDALLPGQTSDEKDITDDKDKWPKTEKLTFYMIANDKRVYLETKAKYTLDIDETLLIVVSDTTEVINPLLSD